MPVFDGLFGEEDNRSIINLLFLLATWHAYAKLRLHTDTTLLMFEQVGTALCQALRHFATVTCLRYVTRELPRETSARATRQRSQAANRRSNNTGKVKVFNLNTYKMHCIPDYPTAIRKYGTTDSYSTQTVRFSGLVSDEYQVTIVE
jgi:hypothetical protein